MTRPLVLVAAGGLARETLEAVRAAGTHVPVAVLDDDPARWGGTLDGVAVLGPAETVTDRPDADVVLCPGGGRARMRLAARLEAAGVGRERYATVVHPAAVLPPGVQLGGGCIVLAGTVITTPMVVGRHVVVMPRAVVTHDDVVEDFVTICAGAALGGNVRVGTGAYLGAGSLVRERLAIGAWATLGMGGVAVTDVPDGEVWVGNPARLLRAAPVAADSATVA